MNTTDQWFILRSPIRGKYISGVVSTDPPLSTYLRYANPAEITERSRISLRLWPRTKSINIDFFSPGEGFFCSRKLANALKEFSSCASLLPASLYKNNGAPLDEDFYFMNLRQQLNGMDLSQSKFRTLQNGTARKIQHLALAHEKIPAGVDIFLPTDVDFYWPLISRRVFSALQPGRFKNMEFMPVGQYQSL